jgi:hypothetical protein
VAAVGASLLAATAIGQSHACPTGGATLNVTLAPPAAGTESTVAVLGSLLEGSCLSNGSFDQEYARTLNCDPAAPETCETTVTDLHPGLWIHRVINMMGDSAGQMQARRQLLLSANSGGHSLSWPLYRSVFTITSLTDSAECVGCLREALTLSETASKPTLIQFSPKVFGSVVLSSTLPPIASGNTTIDGVDFSGRPHLREIDANGLDIAALRLTSADNTIQGLRIANAGGNSDILLIEGEEANRNLLDQLQLLGRAESVCGEDMQGCMVGGVCTTGCGDDGISIRGLAGQLGENIVRACEVVGAFDKGIKITNGGVGRVERSHIHNNRDGGIQATLTGWLVAVENLIEMNRGTNSANGLAANGPDIGSEVPSRLTTDGNISRWNSLRGISIRSLSEANLRHDYVCGNGTPGRGIGFGVVVFDSPGHSATATGEGLGVVHNLDGGVVVANRSVGDFGGGISTGLNAFAFNGPDGASTPANLRNLSERPVSAANNHWERCGNHLACNVRAVLEFDVFQQNGSGGVDVAPAQRGRARATADIDTISPTFATVGELVRLYGRGFDAIEGNAPSGDCATIADANTCRPAQGNCVLVGGQPAEVVAVTPTMLVFRAPFTCFEPTTITVGNRRTRGLARHDFCMAD